ncbi:hypothetical protein BH09MYX1_BH09MYX1_62400 [soil metagenome]
MRSLFFLVTAALLAGAPACTSSVPVGTVSLDGTYVGTVTGSDAWIAAYASGKQIAVYACGGSASFQTASRWYFGTIDARHATVSAEGWTIDLDLSEGHAIGTMTPPSATAMTFDAKSARSGSFEGLYVATDDGRRTGVIVRQDVGKDPIVQGTWFGEADARAQVTPIKPVSANVFDVTFSFNAQARTLTVKPFTF